MKRFFIYFIGLCLVPTYSSLASQAHDHHGHHHHRPDSHAPIGVMADHTHAQGEFMISYKYMFMTMEDQRDGTKDLSTADVFGRGFPVVPTEMDMEMHMLGLMYAPSDWLTLMAMTSYIEMEMDHVTKPGSPPAMMRGASFSTESSDWGDTLLAGLIKFWERDNQQAHVQAGVSLPTGSIDEKDPGPLPYPMQTGSGTYDLKPGVTYLGQTDAISWGAQVLGTIRLDENDNGYTLGDAVDTTIWLAVPLCQWASVSGRLTYEWLDSIDGEDENLMGRPAPTLDPNNHGGEWVEAGIGLNILVPDGPLKGHRIAVESLWPVYQDLNGPQLERKSTWTVGWQKAF